MIKRYRYMPSIPPYVCVGAFFWPVTNDKGQVLDEQGKVVEGPEQSPASRKLEPGEIVVSKLNLHTHFPGKFQLVDEEETAPRSQHLSMEPETIRRDDESPQKPQHPQQPQSQPQKTPAQQPKK